MIVYDSMATKSQAQRVKDAGGHIRLAGGKRARSLEIALAQGGSKDVQGPFLSI